MVHRPLLVSLACVCLMALAPAQPAGLSSAERALISEALANAPDHGLPAVIPSDDDAVLLSQLMAYARAQSGHRIEPRAVNREWSFEPPSPPSPEAIESARAVGRLGEFIAALAPSFSGYRRLVDARARYAALADAGETWSVMASGAAMREGDADPRVEALRARLEAEGYSSIFEDDPAYFDEGLSDSVKTWQGDHGLEADGIVGPATLAELNISVADRLAQIDVNLERWRWLPRYLPPERIEAEVAGAHVTYFAGDEPRLAMRSVVGKTSTRTPLFSAAVSSVVLNPPWNVPTSIAQNELLPRGSAYLQRNNFTFVGGRLVQRPGPDSALGVVKFDFPSPFGVYLHDTPAKAAFDRADRHLSHGCMRLQKPQELARLLLGRQGVTPEDIDQLIAAGQTRRIDLEQTVPLFVVYRTVEVTVDDRLEFRPDAYGWDAQLDRALDQASFRVAAAEPHETECSLSG